MLRQTEALLRLSISPAMPTCSSRVSLVQPNSTHISLFLRCVLFKVAATRRRQRPCWLQTLNQWPTCCRFPHTTNNCQLCFTHYTRHNREFLLSFITRPSPSLYRLFWQTPIPILQTLPACCRRYHGLAAVLCDKNNNFPGCPIPLSSAATVVQCCYQIVEVARLRHSTTVAAVLSVISFFL